MKIVANTKDLIVIDLENEGKGIGVGVEVEGKTYFPQILRISPDHLELDVRISGNAKSAKKTLKEWFHDFIVMNRTLFRINHPT